MQPTTLITVLPLPPRRRTRFLNYLLIVLVIIAAALYLAPLVGSAPHHTAPPLAPPVPVLTKEQKQKKAGDEVFSGPVLNLAIELVPEELERLKRDQRNYAEGTLTENGKVQKSVAIKLKGSAGSFQNVDQKPGLTLSFDKFKGAERFHGMKKFHLNNGAQDGSYLHEFIGGEIARAAGVPASRCGHAFVTLNGRDIGLYVIKEAFTREFLADFFTDPSGDLYDGGFAREIDENTEKDLGDPKDKRDLKELVAACQEGDNAKRWERLGKIVDLDKFLSFMAIEDILCHWDGYNFNKNNYRFYKDPGTGKFTFFAHGMDQVLNDPNFPVMRDFGAMVGNAVWRTPESHKLYQERVEQIYQTVLKPTDWSARVVEEGNKVRDAIAAKNPQWGKDFQGQINTVRDQVNSRVAAIGKQIGDVPKPKDFGKNGVLKLAGGWRVEGSAVQVDEVKIEDRAAMHIRTDGATVASWRKSLPLEPGHYRLEASVRTAHVEAAASTSGEGAGVRISGANRTGQNGLKGDNGWQPVKFDFDAPGGEVVLVAELRASKGEAWFQADSLQLVRVK